MIDDLLDGLAEVAGEAVGGVVELGGEVFGGALEVVGDIFDGADSGASGEDEEARKKRVKP